LGEQQVELREVGQAHAPGIVKVRAGAIAGERNQGRHAETQLKALKIRQVHDLVSVKVAGRLTLTMVPAENLRHVNAELIPSADVSAAIRILQADGRTTVQIIAARGSIGPAARSARARASRRTAVSAYAVGRCGTKAVPGRATAVRINSTNQVTAGFVRAGRGRAR